MRQHIQGICSAIVSYILFDFLVIVIRGCNVHLKCLPKKDSQSSCPTMQESRNKWKKIHSTKENKIEILFAAPQNHYYSRVFRSNEIAFLFIIPVYNGIIITPSNQLLRTTIFWWIDTIGMVLQSFDSMIKNTSHASSQW